jgi:transposase
LHALARKEKHENINDRDPRYAGCKRFGANIQGADRATKTGESNAHTAADFRTRCGAGGGSASI